MQCNIADGVERVRRVARQGKRRAKERYRRREESKSSGNTDLVTDVGQEQMGWTWLAQSVARGDRGRRLCKHNTLTHIHSTILPQQFLFSPYSSGSCCALPRWTKHQETVSVCLSQPPPCHHFNSHPDTSPPLRGQGDDALSGAAKWCGGVSVKFQVIGPIAVDAYIIIIITGRHWGSCMGGSRPLTVVPSVMDGFLHFFTWIRCL